MLAPYHSFRKRVKPEEEKEEIYQSSIKSNGNFESIVSSLLDKTDPYLFSMAIEEESEDEFLKEFRWVLSLLYHDARGTDMFPGVTDETKKKIMENVKETLNMIEPPSELYPVAFCPFLVKEGENEIRINPLIAKLYGVDENDDVYLIVKGTAGLRGKVKVVESRGYNLGELTEVGVYCDDLQKLMGLSEVPTKPIEVWYEIKKIESRES